MKHFFTALCILLGSALIAQNRYEIITEALCWTVGSTDSSIMRVVLQSTRTDERITLGYYNAQCNEIAVSGGQLALGWCNNCTIAAAHGNIFTEGRATADALLSAFNKLLPAGGECLFCNSISPVKTTQVACRPYSDRNARLVKPTPGGKSLRPPHSFALITRRKFLQRRQDYYLA